MPTFKCYHGEQVCSRKYSDIYTCSIAGIVGLISLKNGLKYSIMRLQNVFYSVSEVTLAHQYNLFNNSNRLVQFILNLNSLEKIRCDVKLERWKKQAQYIAINPLLVKRHSHGFNPERLLLESAMKELTVYSV